MTRHLLQHCVKRDILSFPPLDSTFVQISSFCQKPNIDACQVLADKTGQFSEAHRTINLTQLQMRHATTELGLVSPLLGSFLPPTDPLPPIDGY